jgi:membrane protein required for colicin V production
MNWLDIVLIVALGLSILMGLWTGLVRMIFMLIGVIVGMMLKNVGLGLIDRIGGAVLGVVVSAIFFGGILAMYLQYVGPTNIITTSPVAGFLVDKFGIVLGLLPSQFDNIQNYF